MIYVKCPVFVVDGSTIIKKIFTRGFAFAVRPGDYKRFFGPDIGVCMANHDHAIIVCISSFFLQLRSPTV